MLGEVSVENVKEFMAAKGWTGADLSRETKLAYSHVYMVLNGQRKAGRKFIRALVRAGMPAEKLLAGDSDGSPAA